VARKKKKKRSECISGIFQGAGPNVEGRSLGTTALKCFYGMDGLFKE